MPPVDQLTADGYDLQFGTNCLGHFYFTKLLLPLMIESAKSSPDHKARVVNTSSSAHMFTTLNFEAFKDGPQRKKMQKERLYCQSKFVCDSLLLLWYRWLTDLHQGNVVFAKELARRYGDQGIVSTSLNPGNLATDLQRHTTGIQKKIVVSNSLLLPPLPIDSAHAMP